MNNPFIDECVHSLIHHTIHVESIELSRLIRLGNVSCVGTRSRECKLQLIIVFFFVLYVSTLCVSCACIFELCCVVLHSFS